MPTEVFTDALFDAVEMRFASVFPVAEDWKLGGEQGYCVVRELMT